MAIDAARKQDAIIAETVRGTTPATPTFLLVPAMSIGGTPSRPQSRARSRQSHRSAVTTFEGLRAYARSIDMDLAYEVSLHEIFSSLFQADWSANQLKLGSTIQPITLEERYNQAAIYRRTRGMYVDALRMSASLGDAVRLDVSLKGLSEITDTAAIAGATYTAIGGKKPFTPANFVVNDAFGVVGAKVQSIDINFANNGADLYAFGTNDPDDSSLGELDVNGTIVLRMTALTDYSGFVSGNDAAVLDLTMGHTTTEKYRLKLPNCCAYGPDITDPGSTGPHNVPLQFIGKYSVSDLTAAILDRAVA